MTTLDPTSPPPPAMAPFRAVLLDDNLDDREHFRFLLCRHPSIKLLGEAKSLKKALELLDREKADVLFLETEVQGRSILAECSLIPPTVKIIFLTRHQASAVRAFELDAVDFLLKPLFPARFNEAVRRLLRIDWQRLNSPPPVSTPAAGNSVLIPFERGRRGASLNEINLIQAFGNYTRVTLAGEQSEIVLRSLTKWEQLLPAPPFLRVHRNAIVHSRKVLGLEEVDGIHLLRVESAQEKIPVSRRCLAEVRSVLFTDIPGDSIG